MSSHARGQSSEGARECFVCWPGERLPYHANYINPIDRHSQQVCEVVYEVSGVELLKDSVQCDQALRTGLKVPLA